MILKLRVVFSVLLFAFTSVAEETEKLQSVLQTLSNAEKPTPVMLKQLRDGRQAISDDDCTKHLLTVECLALYRVGAERDESDHHRKYLLAKNQLSAMYADMSVEEFDRMYRALYMAECSKCGDSGSRKCPSCNGTRRCDQCDSRGYKVRRISGGRIKMQDCIACVIESCQACGNKGYFWVRGARVPNDCAKCSSVCAKCDEQGSSGRCFSCSGTGYDKPDLNTWGRSYQLHIREARKALERLEKKSSAVR